MRCTLALLTALLAPSIALHGAELKLASVFTDHAVLQREAVVPVWSWADADGDKNLPAAPFRCPMQ